ncbi:MAG: hypothetical protein ACJ786_40365 [Catenulispora sp.]
MSSASFAAHSKRRPRTAALFAVAIALGAAFTAAEAGHQSHRPVVRADYIWPAAPVTPPGQPVG